MQILIIAFFVTWRLTVGYAPLLTLSEPFHNFCVSRVPAGAFQGVQQAFVCGHQFPQTHPLFSTFAVTGLLHLIVVSGSHLSFIRQGSQALLPNLPRKVLMLFFVLYTLVCAWDPPITRAVVQALLLQLNRRHLLNIPSSKCIHWSGVFCLLIFPGWMLSYSLILSWIAALALQVSSLKWSQCTLCFFLLLPILSQWSTVHPIVIFSNGLIGPIFGFIMLPLTLVPMVLPWVEPVVSSIWELFIFLLQQLESLWPQLPEKKGAPSSSFFFLWSYLFIIYGTLRLREILTARKKSLDTP